MEKKQTKDTGISLHDIKGKRLIYLSRCQITREISLSGNTTSLNLVQTEKLAGLLTRLDWAFACVAPCGTVYASKA